MNGMFANELASVGEALKKKAINIIIRSVAITTIIVLGVILYSEMHNKSLQENAVYTLPDGNKIKIKQEGKNSVIMPENEVVK